MAKSINEMRDEILNLKKKIRAKKAKKKKPGGIKCPKCHCKRLHDEAGTPLSVTHSYNLPGAKRRRRVCGNCGHAFYTRETIES